MNEKNFDPGARGLSSHFLSGSDGVYWATMQRVCEHLCPRFQLAMDVLARPWNGLIMASLEDGPVRFGELLGRIEHVGDRMLSARLKDLQARGLVERHVIPGPPVRVEYELTAAGRGFRAVFEAIARWGQNLNDITPRSKPRPKAKALAKARAKVRTGPRR
jgi:DNA-binding HxlR family transcriptional regulator